MNVYIYYHTHFQTISKFQCRNNRDNITEILFKRASCKELLYFIICVNIMLTIVPLFQCKITLFVAKFGVMVDVMSCHFMSQVWTDATLSRIDERYTNIGWYSWFWPLGVCNELQKMSSVLINGLDLYILTIVKNN